MDKELLQAMVSQALRGELLHQLPYYIALLAAFLLASALTSFLGAHFEARGRNYATKADFDELLKQAGQTASTVETIKAEISRADWAKRERATVLREKLEALVLTAVEVMAWIDSERNAVMAGEHEARNATAAAKLQALGTLYFSELAAKSDALVSCALKYHNWLLEYAGVLPLLNANDRNDALARLCDEQSGQFQPLLVAYNALIKGAREEFEAIYQ